MEHLVLRCKHCKTEYTYCTYGNGPEYGTKEGCSMDYCNVCNMAIRKALRRIPVKFRPIKVEIQDDALLSELLKIKEEHEGNRNLINSVVSIFEGDYDNVDIYRYNGKKYYVQYNDDTPDDMHLYVEKEYDILNNKVTEKYWKAPPYNSYMHGRTLKFAAAIY